MGWMLSHDAMIMPKPPSDANPKSQTQSSINALGSGE
jgi:hypothetical protein